MSAPMILLNYSHPLTDAQHHQLEALLGTRTQERTIAVAIDQGAALEPQVRALADAAELDGIAWQSAPLLIVLPGLAPAAAALLAEVHGRMGHFPAIVRLRPRFGSTPTQYEVAELINLQALRDTARLSRNQQPP